MLHGSGHQEPWQVNDQRSSRPWLLPFNRRLRHLNGITLRNLSARDSSSSKLPTARDDEALPQARTSTAKVLADQERRPLARSHSSTDLHGATDKSSSASTVPQKAVPKTPSRPGMRMRRRSTLEWANASPAARQRKFEALTSSQLMHVFISIHVEQEIDPIYVSEIVENTMNPVFESFSLSGAPANLDRGDSIIVRVWVRDAGKDGFQHLLQVDAALPRLRFVAKSLTDLRHPLPFNAVLFHLTDGVYAIPADEIIVTPPPPGEPLRTTSALALPTSTYDALMRLSTLDVCVQDALATRERLENEINQLLASHGKPLATVRSVPAAEDYTSNIEQSASTQRRRLEAARKRRDALRANMEEREAFMAQGRTGQAHSEAEIAENQPHLSAIKEALTQTAEDINTQRRRICEDMERIYPIEPLLNKPLSFTIRALYLPNSVFDDVDDSTVSAALGHVAQMVKLLAFYLSTPLPYEPSPQGSSSTIQDLLSATTASSIYPLYMKGTPRFRFEYGVFLLNKDIEILSNRLGLRVIDPRQMLPNLKYLVYVATAASGDLPMRKAGGLRAFLHEGRTSSRRGSIGSTMSQPRPSLDGRHSQDEDNAEHARQTALDSLKVGLAIRTKDNGIITSMNAHPTMKASKLRNVS